ncbi:ABC-type sugar transport system, substrate-binding protein, contains N-terminal xre family HTH domain [Arenibacter palladensis]|uniref:histidine kinase n=1 Tax=Arenibacter palladensis TaxID=237373 RepID=A0A1M4T7N6_9FLAO|nr:substrate-binding domain-containing protein [Arenibacter palladensis]SHE40523.1 ABC-type sugar transport system, substrate-binding protein, contains N-terminal xre family HTH domain [Arenibacter palladensis]
MRTQRNFFISVISLFILLFSCAKQTEEEEVRIGFSQAMLNDEWRQSMNNAMEVQASLYPNVTLSISNANYNVQQQIAQLKEFISDSVDIIIVSPIQSKPITPIVEEAMNAGIPVLVVDRKTDNQKYTAYVGADNIEVGRNAAKIIVSNVQDSLSVIEIRGLAGSSPADERSLGFHQILDKFPKIKFAGTIEGDWEKESITESLRELLSRTGPVDYIFAHNDRMAKGAWEEARNLGMEGHIKIIGVDGLNGPNGGIQLVKDGVLNATILYPTGGAEAIKIALKILNAEVVPTNNILSTTVIDQFNADIMQNQFSKINEQQGLIESQISAIKRQEQLYYSQNNILKIIIIFSVIIFGLAVYSIYSKIAISKKNRQLELINKKITVQRNQIEKIANEVKDSNEAKLNFFTGLSHEFKTPITLIMSSIESLKETDRQKGFKTGFEVELIQNNSNRLLRLINNLLDFRKVEDQNFNVRASETNIFRFSNNIFKEFIGEAKKRGIKFNITTNNEDLDLFIDRNLMDKVYFNLLSNAFKFTPDNGRIDIEIHDNLGESTVNIHFKDNGIGIPENELKNVFTPFFKGSNNRKNSSGVGLHLSKQFVELHLGKIEVKSYHGTEFIITLFKGNTHFNEDQIVIDPDLADTTLSDFTEDITMDDNYMDLDTKIREDSYSILLIEDNRDLSFFLKNKLGVEYDMILSDGTDGIELAFENIPDVIICDVNLPDKNGFEICEILKNDLRTSHIPVIILTALGNKDSFLQGLKSGADLYLTKPFNYSILTQSIKSLLYNREKLRYYYTNNIHKIDQGQAFGSPEQLFVRQLNEQIKKNLDNTNFSVENLAEALNISRVQLYRKVKAIIGLSVSDYISNYRLENAKTMLENTDLSMSEIGYSTGFSSPNYFSTAFKSKYGVTPGAYKKSL